MTTHRPEEGSTADRLEFDDMGPSGFSNAYFGLLEGLESLFDRRIDLVVLSAVKNP